MTSHIPAALRRFVSNRARERCEYCLLSDPAAYLPHEPDHVVAEKHGGDTTADNLAWACFSCNRHKGSDLASVDPQSKQIVRLFNPRLDVWKIHFQYDAGRIFGLTAEGRATVRLLRFNLRPNVMARRATYGENRPFE